jgi:hypothetical protein
MDDLYPAMLADSTFYPGFGRLELNISRFSLDGSVLTYVSHGRGGIQRENLVDHFDRAAVFQRLQSIGNPVCLHQRIEDLIFFHTRQM